MCSVLKILPFHPYHSPIALDKRRHRSQARREHVGYILHRHQAGRGQFDRRRLGVSVRGGVISDLLPIRKYYHRVRAEQNNIPIYQCLGQIFHLSRCDPVEPCIACPVSGRRHS